MSLIRLQKYIADCGYCSRRNAEVIMLEGRVTINGKIIKELGTKVDSDKDAVKLDGKRLVFPKQSSRVVYKLYKPRLCVTTLFDPQKRETITKFIPPSAPRIYPVGRLDYDTEGLLLLTNDGELSDMITQPRYRVWKIYLVKIKGFIKNADMKSIKDGFVLKNQKLAPARLKIIHKLADKSWLEIGLSEGRHHQIKNVFMHFGHPVLKIKRIQVANLSLGDMRVGECIKLKLSELNELRENVSQSVSKSLIDYKPFKKK
ncbi:MAG: rRNA pseudouridine synthase [SAR324 cluster bacterium]|nr:rRNA pseudouridine synthase [SAR324 cluster bacterium]